MSLGNRHQRQRRTELFLAASELPRSATHPFDSQLNALLDQHGFDAHVEALCAPFYAETIGRPRWPPGSTFAACSSATSKASIPSAASPGASAIRCRCGAFSTTSSTKRRRIIRPYRAPEWSAPSRTVTRRAGCGGCTCGAGKPSSSGCWCTSGRSICRWRRESGWGRAHRAGWRTLWRPRRPSCHGLLGLAWLSSQLPDPLSLTLQESLGCESR